MVVWRIYDQERGVSKTQPERSACQVKQGAFTSSKITFDCILVEEGDGLSLASCAYQGQIFDVGLTIPMVGRAGFKRSFEIAYHMQEENVGHGGVIGRIVLHFKSGALIRRSTENSQVSVTQFQKGENTGLHQ